MATTSNNSLQNIRQRSYLSRDFDSFRAELLNYARQYYPDKIQDFSEASIGGLFLDMAAIVGDNMSFYLDHLYNELNYDTAVEPSSIERALINSSIPINGAAPALLVATIYLEIPVETPGDTTPNVNLLPLIKENTTFISENSVIFTLLEDIEFLVDEDNDGNYKLNPLVEKKIGRTNSNNQVLSYIVSLGGQCVSGAVTTQSISIGSFKPFRTVSLNNSNVTEIISVKDTYGNTYYEVGSLTHDVVYKNVLNTLSDNNLVKDTLRPIPAPYRFTKATSLLERRTSLTLGGGNADTLEDDVIPDPSEFAIAIPYSKIISRIAINPEKLLTTNTLGVTAINTTLTITYRHGGGLDHNISANSLNGTLALFIEFPLNPSINLSSAVRNSLEVTNLSNASGGEDALTMDELVALIPAVKNSQERIVTKEDLLARVYTMPSNLGRVFRTAIMPNLNNPLATQLYIISRNNSQKLIQSPDNLKLNLKKYLSAYRMISDSIDILDAKVINLQLKFSVVLDPALNKMLLLTKILNSLQNKFLITNFHINQPIVISETINAIYSVQGVIAVDNIQFVNISGNVNNKNYSNDSHDIKAYTKKQIIFPPAGGIFEIRYPEIDIIAKVSV